MAGKAVVVQCAGVVVFDVVAELAFNRGFNLSMRAIASSTNSRLDTSPRRTASACPVASIHTTSSTIAPPIRTPSSQSGR
jgi:hypothetical protein